MTTTPVPPVDVPEELRAVVSTTFTYSCAWGCTVSVVESAEQPHMCVGLQVVGALAPELPWKRVCEVTHGLEPLVRTLVGHAWDDGVQQARPDDPVTGPYDASIDDLPRTTITVVPDGHVDDVGCPCGPIVDPVAGLMHGTLVGEAGGSDV